MLRWFGYGFAMTIGIFAACAVTEQYEDWQRRRADVRELFG